MKLNLQCLGRQGDGVRHVLIVGANGRAGHLVKAIAGKDSTDCRIEGFVDDDPGRQAMMEWLGLRYLGPIAALDRLMIEQVIDAVYVCLPLRSSYDAAQRVVDLCGAAGVPVFLVADLLAPHTESDALWCMESQCAPDHEGQPREKPALAHKSTREEEGAPLMTALSAALHELLSGGPAFSAQESQGPQPPRTG